MDKELFIIKMLDKLGIPTKSTTGKDIVKSISEGYRKGGWSAAGFTKFTKTRFPDKPPKQTIFTYLTILDSKAYCPQCITVQDLDNFHYNKSMPTGVQSMCKNCFSSYQSNRPGHNNAKSANRRARIKNATPPWANMNKIQEIYLNCPKGFHVDHIFPLNGENSCGLHVENNLQYLSVEDNLKKGNKLPGL